MVEKKTYSQLCETEIKVRESNSLFQKSYPCEREKKPMEEIPLISRVVFLPLAKYQVVQIN